MVTLAVLPGMLRISLMVANLANPGNSSRAINLLVSQRGIVGLVASECDVKRAVLLRISLYSPGFLTNRSQYHEIAHRSLTRMCGANYNPLGFQSSFQNIDTRFFLEHAHATRLTLVRGAGRGCWPAANRGLG